jgi:transposase
MRGLDIVQESLFCTVHLETFVTHDHPLREIKLIFDESLRRMDLEFSAAYSDFGRESIAPEKLLRALLLQVLFTIRSERQLVEQLHYNLLFRWFVGLTIEDTVWDHSTFSKNRDRLLSRGILSTVLSTVIEQAREAKLLSEDHFTVDGTLIQAWASQKSYQRRDEVTPDSHDDGDSDGSGRGRNEDRDFRGEKRSRTTHESKTDPEALMYKKGPGKEAKLSFMGHVLMENRYGFVVAVTVTQATGTAEREATFEMLGSQCGRMPKTLAADKGYDSRDFVKDSRQRGITPHVAQNINRKGGSAIDGRTTRHEGYQQSMKHRKRVEEIFGWGKTVGQIRQIKVRGVGLANEIFTMNCIGWNLTRMRNLQARTA